MKAPVGDRVGGLHLPVPVVGLHDLEADGRPRDRGGDVVAPRAVAQRRAQSDDDLRLESRFDEWIERQLVPVGDGLGVDRGPERAVEPERVPDCLVREPQLHPALRVAAAQGIRVQERTDRVPVVDREVRVAPAGRFDVGACLACGQQLAGDRREIHHGSMPSPDRRRRGRAYDRGASATSRWG